MGSQKAAPTLDDFLQWQDSPVTQWVMRALAAASREQKAEWLRLSWEAKQSDPLALCELTTRADAYAAMAETGYARWCEINGDEPRKEA